MEGSIMVDRKHIGRGRRKGWGESWSLHSYRRHELEEKEIWKRLKQSLGCIAHSRTLPWLALFLLRRPNSSSFRPVGSSQLSFRDGYFGCCRRAIAAIYFSAGCDRFWQRTMTPARKISVAPFKKAFNRK
jgi:hypothetical protein